MSPALRPAGRTRRVTALAVTVAALAAAVTMLPLHRLPGAVATLGPAAPIVAVTVGAALLVALVPRTPVSLACGALFGPLLGTACALALAFTAAGATFAAGRWLGRDFVAARTGGRVRALDGWVSRHGVLAVAAVRTIPLGPYGLAGYAYGTSDVRVHSYLLGTLIAATPSAISYAVIGAAVVAPGRLNPFTVVPAAAALLFSLTVAVRWRLSLRRAGARDSGRQQIDQFARTGRER